MENSIISLLKVPGFHVVDVQIAGEEIILSVRKRSKTARCPTCTRRTKSLKDRLPETKILHLMLCNQRIYLLFRKRRFVCKRCSRTFIEPISFLPRYQRRSIHASYHALERLTDASFKTT